MDHRQLKFLVALARERHFGRAAQACHVTQPTLSARLKQLEEELGAPLIERGRRFERFTAEGERVLAHARRILAEFEALRGELVGEHAMSKPLMLGAVPSALAEVGRWLGLLDLRLPMLPLRLREYAMPALLQALADHEVELALGYLDPAAAMSDVFAVRPLYRERLALFAAPGRFELPETLDWSALGAYPHCALTPEMQHRRRLARSFERVGLTVETRFEADSMAALALMVGQGYGVAVLPLGFSALLEPLGLEVRVLPESDLEVPRIGAIWRLDEPLPARLGQLLEAISALSAQAVES